MLARSLLTLIFRLTCRGQIFAFNVYMARIPYLPFVSRSGNVSKCWPAKAYCLQMGDFTTLLLYAVPVLYLDCMRFGRNSIARRNTDALRMALGVLQHFDHPAGDVCQVWNAPPVTRMHADRVPSSHLLLPFRFCLESPQPFHYDSS
jgi:hypothetical protein